MPDDEKENEKDFATKAVEHITLPSPVNPLVTPIYANSTYKLDSAAHGKRLAALEDPQPGESPYLYSRWSNPTSDSVASLITRLEQGYKSYVTSTGMAAISTALFSFLRAEDHIVAPDPVYGGTHEIIANMLPEFGIEVSFVDATDITAYRDAIQDNTKIIYGETPANPTMSLTDLEGLGQLSEEFDVISMVDSTFASPYNQQPLDFGVNVVLHSATKYLGGHSDIVAGSITVDSAEISKKIFQTLKLFGGTQSPFDGFLLERGIKTLDVRMERHNHNAMKLAEYLEDHEKVAKVFYPGLPSHPQYELAKKQMSGYSGMIAFEVEGGLEAGIKVIENLNLITLAVSLGGVESLIEHAASMTHGMVDREIRLKGGITDGLLRFSVGIESVDDLIADLEQALATI